MQIKIYSKDYTQLTTLINNSEIADFNDLDYTSGVSEIGSALFTVRCDNSKITSDTIKDYNRVEICDSDGTARWVGVIVEKIISLNTIYIKCYGLLHILDKRITQQSLEGDANGLIATLLTEANTNEDTGISAGVMDLTTYAKLTASYSKVYSSISNIADYVSGQFILNSDRTLDFRSIVGEDISDSKIFRFEQNIPQLSNILSFNVTEVGRDIISKTFGKSNTLTSTQENSSIKAEYGLLEEYKNFRENQDQTTLDTATSNNNIGRQFSPEISLSPEIEDDFEAGDTVNVRISNKFLDLNSDYQILEKRVILVGKQKKISIKVNSKTSDFISDYKNLKENVELLNSNI